MSTESSRAKRGLLEKGEILVSELIAKGMRVKIGDTIVLVVTNKDGSVNGQPFAVYERINEIGTIAAIEPFNP